MKLSSLMHCVGWIVGLSLFPAAGQGQGAFMNLDFELANVPDTPAGQFGGYVPIANGLPGWVGYVGTNETTTILHNNATLGTASISILGPQFLPADYFHGSYAVELQAGYDPSNPDSLNRLSTAIAQTGQIPTAAKTLVFYASTPSLQATFAGQQIPLVILGGPFTPYLIWGGDISAFAGQTGELRFTVPPLPPNGFNNTYLDFIQFSPQAIPEPSVFGLFALGALLLGWRIWQKTR